MWYFACRMTNTDNMDTWLHPFDVLIEKLNLSYTIKHASCENKRIVQQNSKEEMLNTMIYYDLYLPTLTHCA